MARGIAHGLGGVLEVTPRSVRGGTAIAVRLPIPVLHDAGPQVFADAAGAMPTAGPLLGPAA